MPATSTLVLRNFKGNFRAAVVNILSAAGWDSFALERSSQRLQTAVRQEVAFDLGEALNETPLESGTHVYDFFSARLRIRIVTGRQPEQSFPQAEACDLHESYVAATLDLFAEDKQPFTLALLPYYSVKTLRPLGTQSDFELLHFEDFTDITFALEFGIRAAAWPAGT